MLIFSPFTHVYLICQNYKNLSKIIELSVAYARMTFAPPIMTYWANTYRQRQGSRIQYNPLNTSCRYSTNTVWNVSCLFIFFHCVFEIDIIIPQYFIEIHLFYLLLLPLYYGFQCNTVIFRVMKQQYIVAFISGFVWK